MSKRAEVLKSLLPHIATGDYHEYDGYIIFGASSVFDMIDDIAARPSERGDSSLAKSARELVSDLTRHHGRSTVARRASLHEPAPFKATSKQSRLLLEALEKLLGEKPIPSSSNVEDAIDAALTEEVLGKLSKMVDRTVRLEDIRLDGVPNKQVKRYFEEAHRCYLYGFSVACAVLCRAILESALDNVCDPEGIVKREVAAGESYFSALVDKAKVKKPSEVWLMKDEGKDGRVRPVAIAVRDAGNDAIHEFQKFEKNWSNKLDSILAYTRLVLLALYTSA
jgi:hypothetical protein